VADSARTTFSPPPVWRERRVIAHVAAAALVSGAAALLSGKVHPLLLGLGLFLALTATGLVIARRSRTHAGTLARWPDLMPCYVTVQDRSLRIIDANDRFREDFGNRVGDHCFAAYKNSSDPCSDCPVLRTLQDGQVHTSEERVTTADGRMAHVVVTSAPLFDDHGHIKAVIEMSTDITELHRLRAELERSRREYRRLFEAVPCAICVQDLNHRILEANALYRSHFNAAAGSFCYEVCKRRDAPCRECLATQTVADGKVHVNEETLVTADGRRLNFIARTTPIRDGGGATIAVLEVFTDITEVKTLQRELTLMGRAVAGMAHRVKNILMGLEGGIYVVDAAMEGNDPQTMAEGWGMVQRNVARVSRIVKDLLYCSKAREPHFEDDVDPAAVAREVYELYSARLRDDSITFELELDETLQPGTFDRDSLHNLLSNLVANAIDACRFDSQEGKDGHAVILRCRINGNRATVFEVEDNGSGIPNEMSNKVFEEFFSSKGSEGTGIGLLVVQKIAQEHGGSVTFTSEPNQGTKFTVTIPRERPTG
jgi:PAS domain S-box-containing protein